jgi:hypothetical protein
VKEEAAYFMVAGKLRDRRGPMSQYPFYRHNPSGLNSSLRLHFLKKFQHLQVAQAGKTALHKLLEDTHSKHSTYLNCGGKETSASTFFKSD